MPVKYSASDVPMATSPTGILFETNSDDDREQDREDDRDVSSWRCPERGRSVAGGSELDRVARARAGSRG